MVNNVEAKNKQKIKAFLREVKVMGYKEEDETVQQSLKELLNTKGSTKKLENKIKDELSKLKEIIEFNSKEVVLTNEELKKLIEEKVQEAMASIKSNNEKNIDKVTEEITKTVILEKTEEIFNNLNINSNNTIGVNVTVNNIYVNKESVLDKAYNAAKNTTSKAVSWGSRFKENLATKKNKQIGNVLTFFEKIKDKTIDFKDGVKNKIANNIEKIAIKQNEKALEKEQDAIRKQQKVIDKQMELAAKQQELAERKRRLAEKIRGKSKEEVVNQHQEEVVNQHQEEVVNQHQEDVRKPAQEVSKEDIINLSREIADSYRIDFDLEGMAQAVSVEFDRILQEENLENIDNVQAFMMKKIEGLYKNHNIKYMEQQRAKAKSNELNNDDNPNAGTTTNPNNNKVNDEVEQVDGNLNPGTTTNPDKVNEDIVENKEPEVTNKTDENEIPPTIGREVEDNRPIEEIESFTREGGSTAYKFEKRDGKFFRTYVDKGVPKQENEIDEKEFNRQRETYVKDKDESQDVGERNNEVNKDAKTKEESKVI